jgi:hypothetical protein
MKSRCNNPNNKRYFRYGGRGIKYCVRWEDYKNFKEDMFPSYKKGLSLDRIDNDGDYTPENCRWVTNIIQVNNKCNNRLIKYKNKVKTLSEWIRHLGLKSSTVRQRYYCFKWDIDKCFTYKRGQ